VKADFSDRTNERHRLWQDALPLYYLGDGEFVAIDRGSPSGESVVYLHPHLDVAHGTEIAPTFGEFMDRYTQLGCPGPDRERLMPFITSGIGIDLDGGPAQRWLEFLGADLRHSQ